MRFSLPLIIFLVIFFLLTLGVILVNLFFPKLGIKPKIFSTFNHPTVIPSISSTPIITPSSMNNNKGIFVDGNYLFYKNQPIQLRGVAMGEVSDLEGRNLEQIYSDISNNWKANVVRLSVHPGFWKSQRDKELILLKEHVSVATKNNLFVIIDYHVIGWPNGFYYKYFDDEPGKETDAYNPDFERAKDFWNEMSVNFKGDNIIFELWNEPVYSKDEDEMPKDSRWNELKKYYEELISIIRNNKNNAPVFMTGRSFAYDLKDIKNNLVSDSNTGYTWHIYAGKENNNESKWENALDGLYKVKPILVAEWGFDPNDKEAIWYGTKDNYGNKFRDKFLESKRLHNTAWSYSPYSAPNLLEEDWKTRTVWGNFVFDYLNSANKNARKFN